MNFRKLFGMLGRVLTPFWKGAARALLARESADLQSKVKAMIDDDRDASIVRVNKVFDGWQAGIIKGLRGLSFLPTSTADIIIAAVQVEGDRLQIRVVDGIKDKGSAAIDASFCIIRYRLTSIIDAA